VREARAASALDHPNIGTVYEIGEFAGEPFIAMALYQGETLRARIHRGKLAESEVVSIAKQLCSALEAAHAAGIVHRDLKPANVILLSDGTLKLLDFGLAKLTSVDESSLTREGAILGTLAYMAPEQLKSGEIDARADLWALGAVLYEMLSGAPPFGTGPAATIVGRILSEDPKALPGNLGAIAMALLRKDRDERLRSATRVMELLTSGSAPPLSVPKRQRRVLLVSLASISAFVVLVVFIANLQQQQQGSEKPPKSAREVAAELLARYESEGDRAVLFQAADAYRHAGDTKEALKLYRTYAAATPQPPGYKEAMARIAELEPNSSPEPAPSPSDITQKWDQLLSRATREREIGKYDDAARDFTAAYELKANTETLIDLAQTYELAHNDRLALLYWEEFQRATSSNVTGGPLSVGGEDVDRHIDELKQKLGIPIPPRQKKSATKVIDDAQRKKAFQHYLAATQKFDAKDFDGAATEFDAAYQAVGDAAILYNAGQSFRNAKQYGHALLAYEGYLRQSPKAKNRAEVQKRIREMRDEVDAISRKNLQEGPALLTPKF
jgi:serine/threonine protein kinase